MIFVLLLDSIPLYILHIYIYYNLTPLEVITALYTLMDSTAARLPQVYIYILQALRLHQVCFCEAARKLNTSEEDIPHAGT